MSVNVDELDPHAILNALGVGDVISVERAHGGTETAIWRVERIDGGYALRVFGVGGEDVCERERHAMEAARAGGLPVPEVCAVGVWQGRPAQLLTWLPGRTVNDELRRRPWRAYQLGVMLGTMQAQLHRVSAPAVLAAKPNGWINWLGSDEERLERLLRERQYSSGALLHLDYHPRNVLTDGMRITGILDWANAAAGDPRADAARASAILRLVYLGPAPLSERAGRWVLERGWRAGYERQAGPLSEMAPFWAWAGAAMQMDLARKAPPATLARIRRWTDRWKVRCGVG